MAITISVALVGFEQDEDAPSDIASFHVHDDPHCHQQSANYQNISKIDSKSQDIIEEIKSTQVV